MKVSWPVSRVFFALPLALVLALVPAKASSGTGFAPAARLVSARMAINHDTSRPLSSLRAGQASGETEVQRQAPPPALIVAPPGSRAVEQTSQGMRPQAELVESFDGLGYNFEGPQGKAVFRNPSDNSLAVGPDHIFQIVNSRMAIFTKKGKKFSKSGTVLYGPVPTNTLFKGFGGAAEALNSGDAVVRYDQLANRWLVVMPIFRRGASRAGLIVPKGGDPATASTPARPDQPGGSAQLFVPTGQPTQLGQGQRPASNPDGPYSMCYAVSVGPDPLGAYYRYEFLRPLFPDYPRPAIWPDGYYVPTSTGDDVIQKQACVVERDKMLKGEPASEQIVVIDGVSFLNNADIDGKNLPPKGAPNIMLAAGGTQLKKVFEDDGIYVWKFHVDWKDPANTKVTGPEKIPVAPYHFLGDGQLSSTVTQPGTDRRLDSQGDKIMARLVYRRIGRTESVVAVHSINTTAGAGGVRWYEFRVDKARTVSLYQQGTYAPDNYFRWMASPAMDKFGNIGIGYSFGGDPNFPGQRFAGRLAGDPLGQLTLKETVLAEGEATQNGLRWEDYTQTAVDPSDDRTIWYVGDYIKSGSNGAYSSRIGAFRMPEK